MCPLTLTDGSDFQRLADDFVPGVKAKCDGIVVGFEDPVGDAANATLPSGASDFPMIQGHVLFLGHFNGLGLSGSGIYLMTWISKLH